MPARGLSSISTASRFFSSITSPIRPRVIVDLPETSFGLKPEDLKARGLFTEIRYGAMGPGSARVVLTATKPVAVTVADVKADEEGRGFRLVLDAERVSAERFSSLMEEQKWTGTVATAKTDRLVEPATPGAFVVAVDAGHGGIDTGAIGSETKMEEKSVTLAFATQLVEDAQQGKRRQGVPDARQG